MHFFAFEKKNIMDKKIFIRHPLLSFADSDGIIMLSFADSDGIIMSSFVDSDGIIMLSFADSDSITMLRMSNKQTNITSLLMGIYQQFQQSLVRTRKDYTWTHFSHTQIYHLI